jgi:hypothetical protein
MSSQFIKVLVPRAVATPRGAQWAAAAALWIAQGFSSRPAGIARPTLKGTA